MEQKKLGFGFMRLPLLHPEDQASIDHPQVCRMVDAFLEHGFTYFDTAYMYHLSQSETALREALVKRYPRDRFTIASKLPLVQLKEEADQPRIFQAQLQNCGIDAFDYYLLHNLTAETYEVVQRFKSFEFIAEKKREGKIRKIGFSFHDSAELLDQILTAHPETEFVQLQINYLDWDNASIQSRKCYEVARKHQKPVVVMEPLKGGTLVHLPENAKKLLQADHPDQSIASWAIRYAASLPGVTTVLSGMSNLEQLLDNTSYMQAFTPLSPAEAATLQQVVDLLQNAFPVPCTACRYCVEGCPQNIPIPNYFALYNLEKQMGSNGFSIQGIYYSRYAQNGGKASDCIDCKQCEHACPQHLPIARHLQEVAALFETPER